jgi:hypothetical protein
MKLSLDRKVALWQSVVSLGYLSYMMFRPPDWPKPTLLVHIIYGCFMMAMILILAQPGPHR